MSTESLSAMPEARTSATFSVKDPNGFEHLFTIRNNAVNELINEVTITGKVMLEKGWTPISRGYTKPAPQPSETGKPSPMCGTHNVSMIWKTGVSKRTNKPYAFWACDVKSPDGNYCTYQAPKA